MPPKSNPTVITHAIWGSLEQQNVERAIIANFEKQNPDIRVKVIQAPYPSYQPKIQAMMVGDISPDTMMVEASFYYDWAERGLLQDVSDLFERVSQKEDVFDLAKEVSQYNGRYFSFPINCNGLLLYCNGHAFDAIGITLEDQKYSWQDLLRLAPRLSRRTGNATAPTEYFLVAPDIICMMLSFDAELFDDRRAPQQVVVNSPQTRAAFEFMRQLAKTETLLPNQQLIDEGASQLFRDGKIACYLEGHWRLPDLLGKTDFEIKVMPAPSGPAGPITRFGMSGIAISARSQHPEEAKRFFQYYTSPESMSETLKYDRVIPIYRDLVYTEEYLAREPAGANVHFAKTMEDRNSTTLYIGPGMFKISRILQNATDRIYFSDHPVERIIQKLEDDLKRWLKKHEKAERIRL